MRQLLGGSFAPPLTPEKVISYRDLANGTSDEIREAMIKLCDMVDLFNETPSSPLEGLPHPSGMGVVTPLEDVEIKRIWDVVPWPSECDRMGGIFAELPTGVTETDKGEMIVDSNARDRRNAAYHLLWFARELAMDREPITTDKLQ